MSGNNVHPIRINPYRDIILIVGMMVSGKSYFLRWLIRQVKRKIIWDYNWEHTNMGAVTHDLSQIPKAYERKIWSVVYQPYDRSEQSFNDFMQTVTRLSNFLLVIEEVRRYATSKSIPQVLRHTIDTGRHRGVGMVFTSRRSHGINVDIPFNATHIFAFKQHRPEDLKYLEEYMEPAKVQQLPSLPSYYFLHFEAATGKTHIRTKI